jgi:two-component system repressor protein LuxO
MSVQSSVALAVEVMRAGGTDFIIKPFSEGHLAAALSVQAHLHALETAGRRDEGGPNGFHDMIGASPPMHAVFRRIASIAASRASVFITGESGTGKELAAEALHKAGRTPNGPFVALNCGAVPRDLIESELFGHVKGAFTGAIETRPGAARLAHGGTMFLDEIGEMPLDMQVKLLRFIQAGTFRPIGATRSEQVDVRFICATNRDPVAEMAAGRFREDLYYRLHVIPLELPPLRARGDDVLRIATHFLERFSAEEGRSFRCFSSEAETLLRAYHWPGNIRQLANVVRSLVVLQGGDVVTAQALRHLLRPMAVQAGRAAADDRLGAQAVVVDAHPPAAPGDAMPHPPRRMQTNEIMPLWAMEKHLILTALAQVGNDVTRAASLLEVNPSTLYRKLQAWRTPREQS